MTTCWLSQSTSALLRSDADRRDQDKDRIGGLIINKNAPTLKAARIIAKLAMIYRPAADITIEELLGKMKSQDELNFYYTILCTGYRKEQAT